MPRTFRPVHHYGVGETRRDTIGCAQHSRGSARRTSNLSPRHTTRKLEFVYEQVAGILLQLSMLSFDKIGAPIEVEAKVWAANERILSFDMDELVQLANCPRSSLISSTFDTSTAFYSAIADMKVMHLDKQRNDAVESTEDCRRKFIGRQPFKKLALARRLRNPESENGPFRLWCDDLRPGNMLADKDCRIVSVIDWEFTYAASVEYIYDPP
jgi:hypothetical protein